MNYVRGWNRIAAPVYLSFIIAVIGIAPGASRLSRKRSRSSAAPTSRARRRTGKDFGSLPLNFEANRGQTDAQVAFLAHAQGFNLFLTRRAEAVFVLHRPRKAPRRSATNPSPLTANPKASVVRTRFVGASAHPRVEGIGNLPGKANYLVGKDPANWHVNVPTYARVRYRQLYPGVDLVYYGNRRQLEFDLVVSPGADPNQIALDIQGADGMEVDARGNLNLRTASGPLLQRKPVIYQNVAGVKHQIQGGYVLTASHRVGFRVGPYDASRSLVIDPALFYSTYLGGSGIDSGRSIAVDSSGNAYVAGWTASTDFPTTSGAFQPTTPGFYDAFVTKLNPDGSGLVYSTYLGGSSNDDGYGIAIDAAGDAYVTGLTASNDFPKTSGAFQTTWAGGGSDGFVTELTPDGSGLVYSTYLGGSGIDFPHGIALDTAGNAYVTGWTYSSDFPTTSGAFQPTWAGGGVDAFVAAVNPTGSDLVYSTYLGHSNENYGEAIAVDADGNAYVTGWTSATDFPTTSGAFQSALSAASSTVDNAFVTKLTPDGSALGYSTYLGGSGPDWGYGIAVDAAGSAYVTGQTASADFPATSGAFQTAGKGIYDAFVTKLNPDGSGLAYSTYLSGSSYDYGDSLAVDADGNAFVIGWTYSLDFPTTPGTFQTAFHGNGGNTDAFVTKLNSAGSDLLYSTYLGSSSYDYAYGIAIDAAGNAYVTGETFYSDFPTTPQAFQSTVSSYRSAFVTKFNRLGLLAPPPQSGCPADSLANCPTP